MSESMCYLGISGLKDLSCPEEKCCITASKSNSICSHRIHGLICKYKKISEKNKGCLLDHGGWMGDLHYMIQMENPPQLKERKKKDSFV